jgi:hypothetical protein
MKYHTGEIETSPGINRQQVENEGVRIKSAFGTSPLFCKGVLDREFHLLPWLRTAAAQGKIQSFLICFSGIVTDVFTGQAGVNALPSR